MAGNVLYGMAPYFGHTGVTFDAENDSPGPGRPFDETKRFVGREVTSGHPQELAALGIQG